MSGSASEQGTPIGAQEMSAPLGRGPGRPSCRDPGHALTLLETTWSKQHAPGPGGGKGPRPRAAPASRRRRISPRPPVPRLPQLFNPSFFALISLLFSRISVSALQPPASLRRQGDETGDSGLMRSCVIRRRPRSSPHQRSEPTPLLSVKIPAELLLLPHLQSCHFL